MPAHALGALERIAARLLRPRTRQSREARVQGVYERKHAVDPSFESLLARRVFAP